MGIGVPATPVDSDVEISRPTPQAVIDQQKNQGDRLTVLERYGARGLAALIARMDASTGTFIVATTVPFTVKLDGSVTAVAGLKHVGSSYVVGTAGRYIRDTGDATPSVQLPLCFPTA